MQAFVSFLTERDRAFRRGPFRCSVDLDYLVIVSPDCHPIRERHIESGMTILYVFVLASDDALARPTAEWLIRNNVSYCVVDHLFPYLVVFDLQTYLSTFLHFCQVQSGSFGSLHQIDIFRKLTLGNPPTFHRKRAT